MNSQETALEIAKRHGLMAMPKQCHCKHQRNGTGAVFYNSLGILECTVCGGFQEIRKPIK